MLSFKFGVAVILVSLIAFFSATDAAGTDIAMVCKGQTCTTSCNAGNATLLQGIDLILKGVLTNIICTVDGIVLIVPISQILCLLKAVLGIRLVIVVLVSKTEYALLYVLDCILTTLTTGILNCLLRINGCSCTAIKAYLTKK